MRQVASILAAPTGQVGDINVLLVEGEGLDARDYELVVIFSIIGKYGGMRTLQYLAVFASLASRETTARELMAVRMVGSTGSRYFRAEKSSVEKGGIRLRGASWREQDSTCCPTDTAEAFFKIVDENIVETHQ